MPADAADPAAAAGGRPSMSTEPAVAKPLWTDADFETMGWHDNAVHAIALEPAPDDPGSLLLDIDYITEWGPCAVPGGPLTFWVCPATLVFHQAWDLVTDIDLQGWSFQLSISAIERSGPDEHGYFGWVVDGDLFTMRFQAKGFTQYLRRAPIQTSCQRLPVHDRGGLSFDERGYTG
jgi:hypothetical protein